MQQTDMRTFFSLYNSNNLTIVFIFIIAIYQLDKLSNSTSSGRFKQIILVHVYENHRIVWNVKAASATLNWLYTVSRPLDCLSVWWLFMGFQCHFEQYFCYIMSVRRKLEYQKKTPELLRVTDKIDHIIEYISQMGEELTPQKKRLCTCT
jgi:hypothetical protein